MRRAAVTLVAAAALIAPAAAHANSVSLHAGHIVMQADNGEPNAAIVIQSGGNIRFSDSRAAVNLTADSDPGCRLDRANPGVICAVGAVSSIGIDLGDADDSLIVGLPAGGAPVTARGGSGRDVVQYPLAAGRVAVTLDGTANDGPLPGHDNIAADFENVRAGSHDDTLGAGPTGGRLFGLRGRDHLNGGPGNDLIDARDIDNCPSLGGDCPEPRDQEAPERDTVHCGAGKDTVDGDAKDKIARDCEFAIIDNTLDLSDKNDRYTAFRNGLSVHGNGGDDRLTGSSGGPSEDVLDGGKGDDVIEGLLGPDKITGGSGRDRLSGGGGNDTINARDGERDVVNCGQGDDTATVDRFDAVSPNCEIVKRR